MILATAACGMAQAEAFVAASVARTDWDLGCPAQASCDERDSGGTLRAGYRFSPNFGVEARYIDLGDASAVVREGVELPDGTPITGSARASARGAGVNAILSAPFMENFSVFGIVGVARLKAEASGRLDGESAEGSTRASKMYYGVGLAYALMPQLRISVEAERYRLGVPTESIWVNVGAVGLSYSFR